jgi:hypothetical protein
MKLCERIVRDHGQELLDLIVMVYVNFYYSEIEIIDICGRWMPRRTNLKEKIYLVQQAADEVRHMNLFKKGIEGLGLKWDELPLDQYRVRDVDDRFAKLARSDNDLEIQIGMNLYAEGVLAMEELVQLGENAPQYFPDFGEIARDQLTHTGYGRAVARRLIQESPDNKTQAQQYCDWYRDHLENYAWNEISGLIDKGVGYGYLTADYRERLARRFENVMTSVGLAVTWPHGGPGMAFARPDPLVA